MTATLEGTCNLRVDTASHQRGALPPRSRTDGRRRGESAVGSRPPALAASLDLKKAVLVGFSTGGGEVARYIGRHGTMRVAKAALISAVPPLMLKTAANPGGLPIEAFDAIRAGVAADRSQFFKDVSAAFYGANRPVNKAAQGMRDAFWFQGMQCGHKAAQFLRA